MFTFDDLDGMSRLVMLKKQKESIEYWRQLHRLRGAFALWASQTVDLIRQYKATGGASDLTEALDKVTIKGEITLRKLDNQTMRLNEYLADMDTRIGDGSKWYTALDIQKMYAEIEGVQS